MTKRNGFFAHSPADSTPIRGVRLIRWQGIALPLSSSQRPLFRTAGKSFNTPLRPSPLVRRPGPHNLPAPRTNTAAGIPSCPVTIKHPVQAVTEVEIRVSCRPKHRGVPRGEAAGSMVGQIVSPQIRLGFEDHLPRLTPTLAAHNKPLAEQLTRHTIGRPVENFWSQKPGPRDWHGGNESPVDHSWLCRSYRA